MPFTMTATGGTPPYTWSVLSGVPPTGVTLSSSGVWSGTPTQAGSFPMTIKCLDSLNQFTTASYSMGIAGAAPSAVSYNSLVIADAIELIGPPGGVASVNAACPGAIFRLQPGGDLGMPQPTTSYVSSLLLDGERPFGDRSSDRTVTLPIDIEAPTFAILEAAREVLMEAINAETFTLTWTRAQGADPGQLPLVFECFRALPTTNQWGGVDEMNAFPVARMTISFLALPFARSDVPVTISVAPPILGGPPPPNPPVVIDDFTFVTAGGNWGASNECVIGPNSIRFNPCGSPINDCRGGYGVPATYGKNISAANITGLPALSVWVGLGTNYWSTWNGGPVTLSWTLGDASGNSLRFSETQNLTPSNTAADPSWTLVTAAIPQLPVGNLGSTFDYTHVTSYNVSITNRFGNSLRYTQVYLDAITANPQTLATVSQRGGVYQLLGVQGSARTPMSLQVQQPNGSGGPVTVNLPGPVGSFQQWVAPVTGTVQAVCTGSGGLGGNAPGGKNSAQNGGGGGSGECAVEPALGVTQLGIYTYQLAGPGTQQQTKFIADGGFNCIAHSGGNGGTGANGAAGTKGTGSVNFLHWDGAAGAAGSNAGGGGGASAAIQGLAGIPGSGPSGAGPPTGGTSSGGDGATMDGEGEAGGYPGSGGGGAHQQIQGGSTRTGGNGGRGQVQLTYTQAQASFSTLILHRPSYWNPANLNPLVELGGGNDIPDGTTEYSVLSLLPSQAADFNGTYTVVVVANSFDSPNTPRTVTLAVNQYEFAGGPSYTTSVTRTFTPSPDPSGVTGRNGIVVLGELTLPLKAVETENTAGIYTVTITDSDLNDTFYDCLFLDTMGQSLIVNIPTQNMYQNFFVDAPDASSDLGYVLGSQFDRGQAISVLDQTPVFSGGPPVLYPGDNTLLAYCVEGAPALGITYYPHWFLGRTS